MPTLDYYRMQAVFAPVSLLSGMLLLMSGRRQTAMMKCGERIVGLNKNPGITLHIHENATEKELEDANKGVAKVVKKQKSIRDRQQYRYDPLAFFGL